MPHMVNAYYNPQKNLIIPSSGHQLHSMTCISRLSHNYGGMVLLLLMKFLMPLTQMVLP